MRVRQREIERYIQKEREKEGGGSNRTLLRLTGASTRTVYVSVCVYAQCMFCVCMCTVYFSAVRYTNEFYAGTDSQCTKRDYTMMNRAPSK